MLSGGVVLVTTIDASNDAAFTTDAVQVDEGSSICNVSLCRRWFTAWISSEDPQCVPMQGLFCYL